MWASGAVDRNNNGKKKKKKKRKHSKETASGAGDPHKNGSACEQDGANNLNQKFPERPVQPQSMYTTGHTKKKQDVTTQKAALLSDPASQPQSPLCRRLSLGGGPGETLAGTSSMTARQRHQQKLTRSTVAAFDTDVQGRARGRREGLPGAERGQSDRGHGGRTRHADLS